MNPRLFSGLLLLAVLPACTPTQIIVEPDPAYAPLDMQQADYQRPSSGSIYQDGRSIRLFEDSKAFRVGDLLTVTLSESTNASKSAGTTTAKDDSVSIGAGTVFGVTPTRSGRSFLETEVDSARAFSGSGDSNQSNSLAGEITVMVHQILPNGNLLIRGEKILGLNQGTEFIRVSGLVRPQDVSSDNLVVSGKIANARIYYGGGGVLAEANTKGWLTRFFDSPYFPF